MNDLNRRTFLGGTLASLGLGAISGAGLIGFGQNAAAVKPYRIDIHHHFGPPVWVDAVKGRPLLQPAEPAAPEGSP